MQNRKIDERIFSPRLIQSGKVKVTVFETYSHSLNYPINKKIIIIKLNTYLKFFESRMK